MNESPDPLNQHANSVHDYLMKRDNQSSLSEINNLENSNTTPGNDNSKFQSKERQGGNLGNGGSGRHRKLQFHTSSNFFPSSQQKADANSIGSIKGRTSKYEITALMLRQEAREQQTNDETYIITEEDEDEYNVVGSG